MAQALNSQLIPPARAPAAAAASKRVGCAARRGRISLSTVQQLTWMKRLTRKGLCTL